MILPLPEREGGRGGLASEAEPRYACPMHRRVDPGLTARARELRGNPRDTELAIWRRLSRYRPAFTRQFVEAQFIIDLVCRPAKLAVEFDGSQHIEAAEADARRTAYLEAKGWRVIRLWNSDVLANPDGAAQHILSVAAECLGGTHPHPLPFREGRVRRPRYR
jgi:very-short-patch-repair endonuclease